MNILLVEDEKTTRSLIKALIRDQGYNIYEAGLATEAFSLLSKNDIDMVILDVVLPDSNGFFVCKQIRAKSRVYGTPLILMLTAKNATEDLVEGIEVGADDYLKKPFDNRELLSRILALFRRRLGFSDVYKYGSIVINTEASHVMDNGKTIKLSKKEYELLLYLIINKGIVLSRDKILEKIWNIEYSEGNRTVDTYIKQLRQKFEIIEENLTSVRGFGYRLEKI